MEENLWPDFQIGEPVVAPVTIMKEQAKIFDKQMNNKLRCFVNTSTSYPDTSKVDIHMNIFASELGNYSMRLITVQYPLATLYPCTIVNEVTSLKVDNITSLDDFKTNFTREISKPEVVKVIQTLYAQVMAM